MMINLTDIYPETDLSGRSDSRSTDSCRKGSLLTERKAQNPGSTALALHGDSLLFSTRHPANPGPGATALKQRLILPTAQQAGKHEPGARGPERPSRPAARARRPAQLRIPWASVGLRTGRPLSAPPSPSSCSFHGNCRPPVHGNR